MIADMESTQKTQELYLREAGSPAAPAIVFLHGGGLSSREWLPQFDELASDFYCLAPDLPEHGQSLAAGPLEMDRCVEAVAAIIRSRAGGRAHVVGLSMGGAVAVTLLARHPELVERLVISGTAQPVGPLLAWINSLNAPLIKAMDKQRLVALLAKQFGIPPEYREHIEDIGRLTPEAMLRMSDILRDIVVPVEADQAVLVCVGELETIVAKNMARKYLHSLKHTRGVIAPGVGHVWNLQQPALFSAMLRAWFSGSELPGELRPLA